MIKIKKLLAFLILIGSKMSLTLALASDTGVRILTDEDKEETLITSCNSSGANLFKLDLSKVSYLWLGTDTQEKRQKFIEALNIVGETPETLEKPFNLIVWHDLDETMSYKLAPSITCKKPPKVISESGVSLGTVPIKREENNEKISFTLQKSQMKLVRFAEGTYDPAIMKIKSIDFKRTPSVTWGAGNWDGEKIEVWSIPSSLENVIHTKTFLIKMLENNEPEKVENRTSNGVVFTVITLKNMPLKKFSL